MERTCYGLLGYRPTDEDLYALSLRQYLAAVLGWRAAKIEEAAILGSVLFAEDGEKTEQTYRQLLGRRVERRAISLTEYQLMKQRRGWA